MGWAKIIDGGPTGRYTIELDYGQATKDAVLAALSVALAKLDTDLSEANVKLDEAKDKERALTAQIASLITTLVDQQNTLPPGSPPPSDTALKFLTEQRRAMVAAHFPLRNNVERIKYARAQTLRNIAYWNTIQAKETRQAWCTDLTEDRAPGSFVATMDIPGESALLVLAPGARVPTSADGNLVAREFMSPAQAYFNAAILPGWQKEKPTYRWGTIVGLNFEANTADVELANAVSSAQSLPVNKKSRLVGVPVVYMTCNARAFKVGDRCVVQFLGQSWDTPRVVGFLDNPKACRKLRLTVQALNGPSLPASEFWYTPPEWANTVYLQNVDYWDEETIPARTAPEAPQPACFLAWVVQWQNSVTSASRQDVFLDRNLGALTWRYQENQFTTVSQAAYYATEGLASAALSSTLLSLSIREEPVFDGPGGAFSRMRVFVTGTYLLRVQSVLIGLDLYALDRSFEMAGAEREVPIGGSPEGSAQPPLVSATELVPTWSRGGSYFGIAYTIAYEAFGPNTWKPSSITRD